jgi:hypothetical protein
MKYRRRIFFTDKQKSEIWDRWQRGESMNSIGRGFDRASSSIYPLLSRTGGIAAATTAVTVVDTIAVGGKI